VKRSVGVSGAVGECLGWGQTPAQREVCGNDMGCWCFGGHSSSRGVVKAGSSGSDL